MMRQLRTTTCVLLLTCAAAAQQVAASRPSQLLKDLQWLCAEERGGRAFRPSLEVPRWIETRFKSAGLLPLFDDSYLQAFQLLRCRGVNVGGVLPGKDWPKDRRHVIVSAHHDHLGMRGGRLHPGAADNAAGVAAMLEILNAFKGRRGELHNSLVFLAFDQEERGFVGSRHYCKHAALPLEKIVTFTTMDILGRELMNLPGNRLAVIGAERSPVLASLADGVRPQGLELLFVGADFIGDRSDYAPFRQREVPFLFFSTGENRSYHTPGDTVENLDLPGLGVQAAYVGAVLDKLCGLKARPRFEKTSVSHPREEKSLRTLLAWLARGPDASMREAARQAQERLEREPGGGPSRELLMGLTRMLMLRLRGTWK